MARCRLENRSIKAAVQTTGQTGKRTELSDTRVEGLYVRVEPSGKATFGFRYRAQGQQRRYRLGTYGSMTIDQARKAARAARGAVEAGQDPAAGRRAADRGECKTLAAVVETYVSERSPAWTPGTRSTYGSAIGTFTAWAAKAKVKLAADLTSDRLAAFRAHSIALSRRVKRKGGGRRDVVSTGEKRSAAAVNCELRAVKTMLQALRVAGRLPSIKHADQITDNMKLVPQDHARPRPLKPTGLRKLLAACQQHDEATFTLTRQGDKDAPRHEPIAPLVALMLLSGMRLGEALALTWEDVDLDEREIHVRARKTVHDRSVDLSVSPALERLLTVMKARGSGRGRVFDGHTGQTASDARRRLIADYDAPPFQWSTRTSRPGQRSAPTLRSTCGCYLTNAPAIFGGASAWRSAAQLGHRVDVAERHYLGTLKRIPGDATTVEAAMEIEDELDALIA
ncbi:MAG: integrase family protein [Myxococcota bacterium]